MKWRHLQFLPVVVGALVLIGCTGRWLHRDFIWITPLAALVSALLPGGVVRRVSSLALIPLSFVSSYTAGVADYVFVLPNDFEGKITVVYHPDGPDHFTYTGVGKPTIRVDVPDSGLLVTPDNTGLHHFFNSEEWRYRDGRVIKRFNSLAPGFAFVGSRGAEGRGIRPDDPLYKWAIWDHDYYRLSTMNYEVVRGTPAKP